MTRLWKPKKLHFGPAGIPHSAKGKPTKQGVIEVKTLGLDAMELEFVRRISLTETAAKEAGSVARQLGVVLTVHAPYFINLVAKEKEKADASRKRLLDAARIGYHAGAWSVCFHAGYYLKRDPAQIYDKIKEQVKSIVKELIDQGIEIWIRPETTGKGTQFGTLDELLRLSQEVEYVMPVIDFAHIHARHKGRFNTYEEFREILSRVEDALGREGLDNMHIHISGIDYGDKGEIQHLNLGESDLRYEDLLRALKEFNVKGVVICESPNLEEDALLLKKTYQRLKRR